MRRCRALFFPEDAFQLLPSCLVPYSYYMLGQVTFKREGEFQPLAPTSKPVFQFYSSLFTLSRVYFRNLLLLLEPPLLNLACTHLLYKTLSAMLNLLGQLYPFHTIVIISNHLHLHTFSFTHQKSPGVSCEAFSESLICSMFTSDRFLQSKPQCAVSH